MRVAAGVAVVAAAAAAGAFALADRAPGHAFRASTLVTHGYPLAYECPHAGEQDVVDRWKMSACNCTSYVAWALQRNGYRIDWFVPGSMDAWNWPNVARQQHVLSGTAPRTGAVAVWPEITKFGHVAFVTAVHEDGSFDVAEYNLPPRLGGIRFGFDRRSGVDRAGATFVYVPRR